MLVKSKIEISQPRRSKEESMADSFEFDQVGYWSEIKLDIIKEYAVAYSKILSTWQGNN